jgi:hypothetical protein
MLPLSGLRAGSSSDPAQFDGFLHASRRAKTWSMFQATTLKVCCDWSVKSGRTNGGWQERLAMHLLHLLHLHAAFRLPPSGLDTGKAACRLFGKSQDVSRVSHGS